MTTGNVDAKKFLENLLGETMTFGLMVKTVRQCDEITLVDFAKKLGISRQNLCDVESGRKGVSVGRAAQWAKLLGYDEARFVELSIQQLIDSAGIKNLQVNVLRRVSTRKSPTAASKKTSKKRSA